MKLRLLSFLSLLLIVKIYPQENIIFDFDYAKFGYDSTSNYVEFYYSFNQNSMLISETDTGSFVNGILHVTIIDTTTADTVVNREWKVVHEIIDTSASQNKSLIGVVGFVLTKGGYKCEIGGRDALNRDNRKVIIENININPFWDAKISLSDLELASNILQDSENVNSIFYKNTYEVIPTPTSVFGDNQPVIFYYCELYNLKKTGSPVPLQLAALVYNSRGIVVSKKVKEISRSINSRVEVGSVLVNKLPTDTYTMVLALIDSSDNYGVSSTKKFFVYNPSVEISDSIYGTGTGVLASEFGVMSEEELDDLFNKSKYIASSDDINQYEKISTLEGKREFLHNFWKIRDDEVSTVKNEFYLKYRERVEGSNHRFGSVSKAGWKSDRGRVFIIYGEPSEIERYPNQIDTKPYEVWYYNEIEGGVIFVFADISGFSDYILVHSTLRGELRDDNWMRRITSF
jgi:GWxTD domain-containing protein